MFFDEIPPPRFLLHIIAKTYVKAIQPDLWNKICFWFYGFKRSLCSSTDLMGSQTETRFMILIVHTILKLFC